MAISGLVLTLTPDAALQARTVQILGEMPTLELGELDGARLPLVADTPDRGADRDLFAQLQAMPGVLLAEVAYVWFDDTATFHGADAAATPTVALSRDPRPARDTAVTTTATATAHA